MTFEQAAAVPQAAGLAMQALRKGGLAPGQKVLINGGGGGVGTFAVQMAKAMGAEVSGVDHARKLDVMRSLGYDRVVDYTSEDFTRTGHRYDLIVDVEASRAARDYRRGLSPGGRCVLVGGPVLRLLGLAAFGSLQMSGGRKVALLLYRPSPDDLVGVNELFEDGKLTPVIDSTYPLEAIPEAMRHFESGTFTGKIVIKVGEDSGS
jgi:NADPH:quinone reductase-like Zn-dependent oxidoreductase